MALAEDFRKRWQQPLTPKAPAGAPVVGAGAVNAFRGMGPKTAEQLRGPAIQPIQRNTATLSDQLLTPRQPAQPAATPTTTPVTTSSATPIATPMTEQQQGMANYNRYAAQVKADPSLAQPNVADPNPPAVVNVNGAYGSTGLMKNPALAALEQRNPRASQVAAPTSQQPTGQAARKNIDWTSRLQELEQGIPQEQIDKQMASADQEKAELARLGQRDQRFHGLTIEAPNYTPEEQAMRRNREALSFRRENAAAQLSQERGYGVRGEEDLNRVTGPEGPQFFNPNNPKKDYATIDEAKRGQSYDTALNELTIRKGDSDIASEAFQNRVRSRMADADMLKAQASMTAAELSGQRGTKQNDPIKLAGEYGDQLVLPQADGSYRVMQPEGLQEDLGAARAAMQASPKRAKDIMDRFRSTWGDSVAAKYFSDLE